MKPNPFWLLNHLQFPLAAVPDIILAEAIVNPLVFVNINEIRVMKAAI